MAKLRLEIEVEYDPDMMYGDDPEGFSWFRDRVLLSADPETGLVLHSNEIGDEIGYARVVRVIEGLVEPGTAAASRP